MNYIMMFLECITSVYFWWFFFNSSIVSTFIIAGTIMFVARYEFGNKVRRELDEKFEDFHTELESAFEDNNYGVKIRKELNLNAGNLIKKGRFYFSEKALITLRRIVAATPDNEVDSKKIKNATEDLRKLLSKDNLWRRI